MQCYPGIFVKREQPLTVHIIQPFYLFIFKHQASRKSCGEYSNTIPDISMKGDIFFNMNFYFLSTSPVYSVSPDCPAQSKITKPVSIPQREFHEKNGKAHSQKCKVKCGLDRAAYCIKPGSC